jgi:hypothetical protein
MVTRLWWCAVFILGISQSAAAGIQSSLLDTVTQLPTAITQISRCGTWRQNNQSGYVQLVLGEVNSGAGTELYVRWISDPTQDEPAKLVRTIGFPELNDDHAQYYFTSVECSTNRKIIHIKVSAQFEHDEHNRTHHFLIKLVDIGRYQLAETTRSTK